ncbi:glycoside hydrolase family 78 protein [Cadophora sp. DSE1049]|nr:glycoside hydrolase family 78 protein [Cadophora sp. DSE1049]
MAVRITDVTLEHHREALGIGETKPRISWRFAGVTADWVQSSYEVEIENPETPHLPIEKFSVSSSESSLVPWPGKPLDSRASRILRVRALSEEHGETPWSDYVHVEAGILSPEDWKCSLIQCDSRANLTQPHAPVVFRYEFDISTIVHKARLFISAHGIYEAEINGQRVGDQVLAPGWTPYEYELSYQTFDVTFHLKQGRNAIAAHVGEGWYCGRLGFGGGARNIWGDTLGLLAQIVVTDNEGNETVIVTDDQWQFTTDATIQGEIYDGESYDARLEQDWSSVGISTEGYKQVHTAQFDTNLLRPFDGPPVRAIQEISPVALIKSPSGKRILDFGQNLVGWLRIRVKGKSGHVIRLQHVEVLEFGECAIEPLRTAKAQDTVILSDSELEWQPKFTFHGFRYVQVDDWPTPISDNELSSFVAVVIHTDMERTGWFDCSDDMLNKLHENVVWSMRGNFVSIPTDCPQRDERLGWSGDLQAFAPTATFLYNCHGMLKSWFRGAATEQIRDLDGAFPLISPNVWRITRMPPIRAAIWGDCSVLVPWEMYTSSGDSVILGDLYDSMKDWVQRGVKRDERGLWDPSNHQLGDWLDPLAPLEDPGNSVTDPVFVANAFLIHTTDTLVEICRALSTTAPEGSQKHETLLAEFGSFQAEATKLREAFASEYITPSGRVLSDSQTAIAIAIHFSLIPTVEQEKVAAARLNTIIRQNARFKIATGFAGTPVIGHALSKVHQYQLFYRMLLHKKPPSWLYPVTMGATTIWERWTSMEPDNTVAKGNMTSFNHYALGAVADWMHKFIGGLHPLQPGWKRFAVSPVPGGTLTHATVSHLSPYGLATSKWHIENAIFCLRVTVPPNTTAEIKLPGRADPFVVGSGVHDYSEPYGAPPWPPLPIYAPFMPHEDDEP